MRPASTAQLKDLEFYASNHYEYSIDQMLEMSGYKLTRFVLDQIIRLKISNPRVLILCGSGNKGAAGFVALKYFTNLSLVSDFYVHDFLKLRKPAKRQFELLQNLSLKPLSLNEISQKKYSVVVDCLVGTGLQGGLHSSVMTLIDHVNSLNALRVSLDLPSGLHPDTGEPFPVAVLPDFTLALAAAKIGFYTKVGKQSVGQVFVADVGIPKSAYIDVGIDYPFNFPLKSNSYYF